MTAAIKTELYAFCMNDLQKRENTIRNAIAAAQEAGNEETKSSAGDKYETTRSMMQLEIEQNTAHLSEILKLRNVMETLRVSIQGSDIRAGSMVATSRGNFYLSISAGTCTIGGQDFLTLSTASPLGAEMMELKVGDKFTFRGNKFEILEVA